MNEYLMTDRLLEDLAGLFSSEDADQLASDYLKSQGLMELISNLNMDDKRISPCMPDLARLHLMVRRLKCFNVLEYGVGFSTLVIADALSKNRVDWLSEKDKPRIRKNHLFTVNCYDAEPGWLGSFEAFLPSRYKDFVILNHARVVTGQFNGRQCHFYEELPSGSFDLIYLDGPSPSSVQPLDRLSASLWNYSDQLPMAADLLSIENFLIPGTAILVDGRTANARFIQSNFYRNWGVCRNDNSDVTLMLLKESPLGTISRDELVWRFGSQILGW